MAITDIAQLAAPDPRQERRRRLLASVEQAIAQLTPEASVEATAGAALGASIGQAILERTMGFDKGAELRNKLLSQVDPANPDSLTEVAKAANQAGDTQLALALADRAANLRAAQAKAAAAATAAEEDRKLKWFNAETQRMFARSNLLKGGKGGKQVPNTVENLRDKRLRDAAYELGIPPDSELTEDIKTKLVNYVAEQATQERAAKEQARLDRKAEKARRMTSYEDVKRAKKTLEELTKPEGWGGKVWSWVSGVDYGEYDQQVAQEAAALRAMNPKLNYDLSIRLAASSLGVPGIEPPTEEELNQVQGLGVKSTAPKEETKKPLVIPPDLKPRVQKFVQELAGQGLSKQEIEERVRKQFNL